MGVLAYMLGTLLSALLCQNWGCRTWQELANQGGYLTNWVMAGIPYNDFDIILPRFCPARIRQRRNHRAAACDVDSFSCAARCFTLCLLIGALWAVR